MASHIITDEIIADMEIMFKNLFTGSKLLPRQELCATARTMLDIAQFLIEQKDHNKL